MKQPPPSEGSLVEFDDEPTQLGQSWFPSGHSLPRALPSATSVPNLSAPNLGAGLGGVERADRVDLGDRGQRPSSRPPSTRPAQSNVSEDVGSFPAASSTLPPSLERAPNTHSVRRSTFAAAKGLIVGLSLTGLVGLGAFAYKQMTARAANAGAAGPSSSSSFGSQTLTLDGDVEPARQASLQVRGGGRVQQLSATLGKPVHEGDVLAIIDGPSGSTLKAPFDGVVTALYTNAGAQLAPGAGIPVADLADTSRVRVRLALAPGQEAQVRAGDPVTVWSDADPSRTVRATIARVIPPLNARPGSAELELDHAGLTPLDHVHAQLR